MTSEPASEPAPPMPPEWAAFAASHPTIRSGDWEHLLGVDWPFQLRAPAQPEGFGPPVGGSLGAQELIRGALAVEVVAPSLAANEELSYVHTRCKVSAIGANTNVPVSLIVTSTRVLFVDYAPGGHKSVPDDVPPRRLKLEFLRGAGLNVYAIQPRITGGFVILKHGIGFPKRRIHIFVPAAYDGTLEEAQRAARAIRSW